MYAWIDLAQAVQAGKVVRNGASPEVYQWEGLYLKRMTGGYALTCPDLPEFTDLGELKEFVSHYTMHHTFAPCQNESRSCGVYGFESAIATLDFDEGRWQLKMKFCCMSHGQKLYHGIRTSQVKPMEDQNWGVPVIRT